MKICFWCFLLKATFVSEPAALDAGPTEASPKGSPFPTVNHVITVSRMAPVNNKSLLPKKSVLSVINASKDWHGIRHISKISDPTRELLGCYCSWDMASGGAQLLGEHPCSRAGLLKHSGLGTIGWCPFPPV